MAGEFTLASDFQNSLANTPEVMKSISEDTLITAFTATNNTGVNRSFKAYIYSATGSPQATSPNKFVTALRGFDLAPAIVGHVIPKGGSLRVESNAASSLVFRATGRQV